MDSELIREPKARVAVIGAGIGGLAAADALCRAGIAVDIYEKEPYLGGLASRVSCDGLSLDRYYHFVCGADDHLVRLCADLDIPITWQPSRTSFYYNGTLYPFGSTRHLLTFAPLTMMERLRQARMMLASYRNRDWNELDTSTAEEWLIQQVGEHAYKVIWYPLLKVKFGDAYGEVSAAWIWHRVHRLLTSRRHVLAPERLGFVHRGFGEVIARLAEQVEKLGGTFRTQSEVLSLTRLAPGQVTVETAEAENVYTAVVCALPAPVLGGLIRPQSDAVLLRQVRYIGVVCALLVLARPVTDSFWINTNDPRIPFNGFIEFSNLNPAVAKGRHVVYVPLYCDPADPRYTTPDEAFVKRCVESLRLIQPALRAEDILQWRVYRDRFAQPVCPCGFSNLAPTTRGPWPEVYLAESSQLYPEDRNLSSAVALARQVAQQAVSDLRCKSSELRVQSSE